MSEAENSGEFEAAANSGLKEFGLSYHETVKIPSDSGGPEVSGTIESYNPRTQLVSVKVVTRLGEAELENMFDVYPWECRK